MVDSRNSTRSLAMWRWLRLAGSFNRELGHEIHYNPPTVSPKKSEHPSPHAPKGILKGIPAALILKPCSKLLEFTIHDQAIPEPT